MVPEASGHGTENSWGSELRISNKQYEQLCYGDSEKACVLQTSPLWKEREGGMNTHIQVLLLIQPIKSGFPHLIGNNSMGKIYEAYYPPVLQPPEKWDKTSPNFFMKTGKPRGECLLKSCWVNASNCS